MGPDWLQLYNQGAGRLAWGILSMEVGVEHQSWNWGNTQVHHLVVQHNSVHYWVVGKTVVRRQVVQHKVVSHMEVHHTVLHHSVVNHMEVHRIVVHTGCSVGRSS